MGPPDRELQHIARKSGQGFCLCPTCLETLLYFKGCQILSNKRWSYITPLHPSYDFPYYYFKALKTYSRVSNRAVTIR